MRPIDADALMSELMKVRWAYQMLDNTQRADIAMGGLRNAEKKVEEAPTIDAMPRWIPCEERFPEEYGEYLVTMNDGSVQECGYIPENNGDALISGWNTCESTGFVFIDEWDVIAWMPLPEPYGAEREDDEVHKNG